MHVSISKVVLVVVGVALLGCTREETGGEPGTGTTKPASAESVAAAIAKAKAATTHLTKTLGGELKAGLEKGDAAAAVDICATVAQKISDQVAAEEGLYLRRTSLRLRNPKNAPDAFEKKVLTRWEKSGEVPDQETEEVTTPDGKRELRVMQPIRVKPLCVMCHGASDALEPAIRTALAKHYPEDRAVGFAAGDLRGAFSVRVPLAP